MANRSINSDYFISQMRINARQLWKWIRGINRCHFIADSGTHDLHTNTLDLACSPQHPTNYTLWKKL